MFPPMFQFKSMKAFYFAILSRTAKMLKTKKSKLQNIDSKKLSEQTIKNIKTPNKTNKTSTSTESSTKPTGITKGLDVINSSFAAYKEVNRMLILSFAEIFATAEINDELNLKTFDLFRALT